MSLCGTRGVVPVLRELRGWIAQAGAAMGVLVALMFLHERGVAAELRDDRAELPGGEGGTCGQMVLALSNGEEDVRQAARFIGDLYDSVTAPWATEAAVRRHVRGSLEAHLQEWVREALPVPELAASMRQLLEHLARTHDGKLRELVVQLVTRGDFTRNPEMAAFAATLRL